MPTLTFFFSLLRRMRHARRPIDSAHLSNPQREPLNRPAIRPPLATGRVDFVTLLSTRDT